MPLLEVSGLEKWYGRRKVVNGVEFDVDRGEVVGLLGPNGAGKTTSFRMTIGLIDSDGGKVVFDGKDVTRSKMYLRARAGMGYLPQDKSVFRQLSVEDNLMAILETRRDLNRKQRIDRQNELLDQFGLTKIRKTKANRVSGGEGRRLEIARCLITEPKLIMLDEPFAGIDPKTVGEIQDQIRDLVERYNIGILLTDHQFRETLEVTDRCYLIREGRVFAYGNREEILNNPDVRRHYIGERFDVGHLLDRRRPVSLSHQHQAGHHANPAPAPAAVEASVSAASRIAPAPGSAPASAPIASETATASAAAADDGLGPPLPPEAMAAAAVTSMRPAPAAGPRVQADDHDDDSSVLLGSFITTEVSAVDIEAIGLQSSIGTDASDLPPPPPLSDEPVPGVYEEPGR
ncbi:MAG: LPS export ABC transporter ATP-binding protein [Isosphaeraceae bacterium]